MPTHLIEGKNRREVDSKEIEELIPSSKTIVLDIGAGDGKGSLRFARKHADSFVIALDSSFDSLVETSKSALKKPSRGGTSNIICLYGNIKTSHNVLSDLADLTRVYLPWGDLLEGIALISEEIVSSIVRCTKPGGEIEIVINAEIWKENLPKYFSHLGEITPQFFESNSELFSQLGFSINQTKALTLEEIKDLDTTWSAKLMSTRDNAQFIMAKGVRI